MEGSRYRVSQDPRLQQPRVELLDGSAGAAGCCAGECVADDDLNRSRCLTFRMLLCMRLMAVATFSLSGVRILAGWTCRSLMAVSNRRVCFIPAEPKTLTLRPVESQALTCSPVRRACGCSLDVQRIPQPLMGERQRGTDTRKQNSVTGYHRRSNAGVILRQPRSNPSFLASFSDLSLRSASFLSRSLRSLRPRSRAS